MTPSEGHLVIEVHGILATVEIDGAPVRCSPQPNLDPYPVVGDRVAVAPPERAGDPPSITAVLPRRSQLARLRHDRSRRSMEGAIEHVLAANINLAVIVAAVARPPFHPRFIDRYMVLAERGGIAAALCLNKCDLGTEPHDLSVYRDLGLPIVRVSAKTGEGLDALRALVAGKTVVFTGHSGVGKSSLVNALFAEELADTGDVGGKRGQGRHTTSRSALYRVDATTAVVDTPGIRSLSLAGIEKSEMITLFPDLAIHAEGCRFRDCSHDHEPGCAVRAAAESGEAALSRYETYRRLLAEER